MVLLRGGGIYWQDKLFAFRQNEKYTLLALQAAVDQYTPTAQEQKAGDVNADGTLDASDALLILQKAVDKIQAFPVEA